MQELHRRLLKIGFEAGDDLALVLAGGYALAAHELIDRPSRDVDFATSSPLPLDQIVLRLAAAYRVAGFSAEVVESTSRMARLVVSAASESCDVDLLKEAIGPPVILTLGPVLALDDAVGLKMRALYDRAAHRDFIDLYAASSRVDRRAMESLGARHTIGFRLEELAERLGAVQALDGELFAFYGLSDDQVSRLRQWAAEWSSDIWSRLAAGEDGPVGAPAGDWDVYLDEL